MSTIYPVQHTTGTWIRQSSCPHTEVQRTEPVSQQTRIGNSAFPPVGILKHQNQQVPEEKKKRRVSW